MPGRRTNVRNPIVKFGTTDTLSGLTHYELKLVSLQPQNNGDGDPGTQFFFIEAESPYILPTLAVGSYDVFVRAYDKAGNYLEVVKRIVVTPRFFGFSSAEGLILGPLVVGWRWLLGALLFLVLVLGYIAYWFKKKHDAVHDAREAGTLPENVSQQLEELRRYKSKYGGVLVLLLFLAGSLFTLSGTQKAHAQVENTVDGVVELAPPYVTTLSKNITNNEIFYVGGETEIRGTSLRKISLQGKRRATV